MTDEERKERRKATDRRYYAANREKATERQRKYYTTNADKIAEYQRNYRETNPEKILERARKYRETNAELVRSKARTRAKKRHANKKSDPIYLMARRAQSRMWAALTRKGFSKESKTAKTLGCSWKQFAKHIESQFTDGMNWDNQSEWHLDHVVPLSCATTIEGLEKLSHYTNIRPLWAAENLRKSDNLVLMS